MIRKVIQIKNQQYIEIENDISIVETIKQNKQDLFWFDYSEIVPSEWENLVDSLQLNNLEKLFLTDKKAFPKVEIIKTNGLYLRVPTSNAWKHESHYVHLILIENVFITVSRAKSTAIEKALQQLKAGAVIDGVESIFLLMFLLESLEEHLVNNYLEARNIINTFITSLEVKPRDEDDDNVVSIKGKLDGIVGQCEEFLFGCTLLRSILGVPIFPSNTKRILSDIVDTLTHLENSMRKLDNRLEDQLHRIDSHLRELTDKRLRMLTVLSSIFLPLTFISSLYGMNFEFMPELAYKYAYPICLAVMFIIALIMIAFFAIKGWFK